MNQVIISLFLLSYSASARCIRHQQKAITAIDELITNPYAMAIATHSSTSTDTTAPTTNPSLEGERLASNSKVEVSANPSIKEERIVGPSSKPDTPADPPKKQARMAAPHSTSNQPTSPSIKENRISPPPQPRKSSQTPGIGSWELECLREHNLRRASSETLDGKSLPALVWDQKLYQTAKNWANKLAKDDKGLTHSGPRENLHRTTDKDSRSCKGVVDSWFNEYPLYNNEKIGDGPFKSYGHFTQLVWPKARKLACACSDSSKWRYSVCHYDQ
jgi:uncharacterized protein YkwD